MNKPEEDEQLAAYQEAVIQLAAEELPPDEMARRLRNDERVAPFHQYVATFDLRCIEVISVLMRRWARRGTKGDFK